MPNLKNLLMGEMPVTRVYEKGKVTYPQPVKDGLLLWYDFLGRKNTDNSTNKGIAQDLSGNGKNANLYNFAYSNGSGYERGLMFDRIDDIVDRPALTIPADSFTLGVNEEIYSYQSGKFKLSDLTLSNPNQLKKSRNIAFAGIYPGVASKKNSSYTITSETSFGAWIELHSMLIPEFNATITNTLSVEIRASKPPKAATVPSLDWQFRKTASSNYKNGNIPITDIPVNTWTKKTITVPPATLEEPLVTMYLYWNGIYPPGTVIEFRNLKIEPGTVSTPHAPSVDDVLNNVRLPYFLGFDYPKLKSFKIYNRALSDSEILENVAMEKERWNPSYIPVQDGLETWYDFRKNSNMSASKALSKDLSGNGKDATLQNFAFAKGSGYREDGLKFDGVDDHILIPNFSLSTLDMGIGLDENVYSYKGDKVRMSIKGGAVEETNKNLYPTPGTLPLPLTLINNEEYYIVKGINVGDATSITLRGVFEPNTRYTVRGRGIKTTYFNFLIVKYTDGTFDANNPNFVNDVLTTFTTAENKTVDFITFDTGARTREGYIHKNSFKVEKGITATSWSLPPGELAQATSFSTLKSLRSLQIYSRALTDAEILHNAKIAAKKFVPVPIQEGLQLWYDFSKKDNLSPTKTLVEDLSQTGNTGTLTNFSFTEGSGYREGLRYDGIDDSINFPIQQLAPTQNWTASFVLEFSDAAVGAWMDLLGDATDRSIFFHPTTGFAWYIKYVAPSSYIPGTNWKPGDLLPLNKKMFLAVKCEFISSTQVQVTFYHNDKVLVKTHTIPPGYDGFGFKWLGSPNGGRFFKGKIYSTEVYDKALTAEEILHNYTVEKEKWKL